MMKHIKRLTAVLLALVLAAPASVFAAGYNAAAVSSVSSFNNVCGGVSFIEPAGSMGELRALVSADVSPSGVIFGADSDLNVTDRAGNRLGYTLRQAAVAIDGAARPIVSVSDEYTARAVCTFFEYSGVSDFFVMSSDITLLKICRDEYSVGGTVFDLTDSVAAEPGLMELRSLCADVTAAGVNVCLFSEDCISPDTVRYLYTRLIYTWCESGDELDISAAAELILTGAFAVVSRDTDVLYEAATRFLAENTLTRMPVNVGHRGSQNHAPQNTLEGFLLAEEEGADAVELDLYISADGELVIMHNPTTGGTCGTDIGVEDSTLAQLKELSADRGFRDTEYAGVKIPTLREVYEELDRETVIFVEVKSTKPECVRALAALTEEFGFYDRIVVISFHFDQLVLSRELMPTVPCAFLASKTYSDTGEIISALRPYSMALDNSYSEDYDEYLSVDAKARAFPVLLWTFYNADGLDTYMLRGYLGLTNDLPYRFASIGKKLETQLVGDIVPGSECSLEYKLTSYDGSSAKAKKVTVISEDPAVQIAGRKVTFDKAGEYTLFVRADMVLATGTCSVYGVLHVSVPSEGEATQTAYRMFEPYADGDVNADGIFNLRDVSAVIRYLSGYSTEVKDISFADVNGDGTVNLKDVSVMIRDCAGYAG